MALNHLPSNNVAHQAIDMRWRTLTTMIITYAHVRVGKCGFGGVSGLLDQFRGHPPELIVCLLTHPAELQLEWLLLIMYAVQAAEPTQGQQLWHMQ
jgi:hypothetical protein